MLAAQSRKLTTACKLLSVELHIGQKSKYTNNLGQISAFLIHRHPYLQSDRTSNHAASYDVAAPRVSLGGKLKAGF